MGKKNKSDSSLGRALIKDRFGGNKGKKFVSNSMLHTTEVQDGYDWGRLNLQSVTEESSFQEFLSTAELAGTEFKAEKLNIKYIDPSSSEGLLSKDEMLKVQDAQKKHKDCIRIPRRPRWDSTTTPEQLDQQEKEYFLEWRRSLAKLQEDENVLLTPYEKNLEFWRQLWRVVERSDVIVQIVDARNPLLFRCEDLELYVKEVSENKMNMLLINKSDFLTEKQRQYWADYFSSIGLRVVFFSALAASEEIKEESSSSKDINQPDNLADIEENIEEGFSSDNQTEATDNIDFESLKNDVELLENSVNESEKKLEELNKHIKRLVPFEDEPQVINSSKLYKKEELIELFRTIHKGPKETEHLTTIGLVGYPNVGKSSTINALLSAKKVSVSATPGKTKHFQTLYLDNDILLCDCPGLVMPSFVFTKAEMILNGILPVDQMRDHVPPINLLATLIPRYILEDKYGIMLPIPSEYEEPDRPPTSAELLNAYGYVRGFMTANGQPDNARAARYILKDFVNGRLLYCHAPPNVEQNEYHIWPQPKKNVVIKEGSAPKQDLEAKSVKKDFDEKFFQKTSGTHIKGKIIGMPGSRSLDNESSEVQMSSKPWKIINKHQNKKKREKLRRVYAHLDQH